MEGGSPRASMADDVYSLSTTRDDDERAVAADETTSLLSAGSRASYDPLSDAAPRKDSWVGYDEFDGLPWHKRPNVRHSPTSPGTSSVLVLTLN